MLWLVVRVETKGEVQLVIPGQGLVGKNTWLSEGSLVDQVMMALAEVIEVAEIEEMVGGVVSEIGVGVGAGVGVGGGVGLPETYS